MGLLRQTIAYSQEIMGINIKVITQASQPCLIRELEDSKQPGPYRSWFVWFNSLWLSLLEQQGRLEQLQHYLCLQMRGSWGSCSSPWWDVHETPCPWTSRSCSSGCAHIHLSLCVRECSCPSHPVPGDPACSSSQLWPLKQGKSSLGSSVLGKTKFSPALGVCRQHTAHQMMAWCLRMGMGLVLLSGSAEKLLINQFGNRIYSGDMAA